MSVNAWLNQLYPASSGEWRVVSGRCANDQAGTGEMRSRSKGTAGSGPRGLGFNHAAFEIGILVEGFL